MDALHNQIGSISHRSQAFRDIYQFTDEQLRILLNIPSTHQIYVTSSATEIWERMLLNTVNEQSFHFVQGAFSQKFYEYALMLDKKPTLHRVSDGLGFEDIGQTMIPSDIELICFTQNETSSGIQVPVEDIALIKKQNPKALVCCDIVSAVPFVQLDFSVVDSAFFSVQKGMGMPPGLGVWIVNEACLAKADNMEKNHKSMGAHFRLSAFAKNYKKFETPSTPNTVAVYVLGKIAQDMNQYGIQRMKEDTLEKWELLHHYINHDDRFEFMTTDIHHLSKTTIVANSVVPASELNASLKKYDMIIAGGYGQFKDQQIRIANFPSISLAEMERLISVL